MRFAFVSGDAFRTSRGSPPYHDLAQLELAGIDLQTKGAPSFAEAGYLQVCLHRVWSLHSTFRHVSSSLSVELD